MSFWTLEENTQEENLGQFSLNGGEMEPIPNKTQVLAFIDEIKWDSYEDNTYISARWNIIKPDEYKNRRIFQKIRVNEVDTKKADKAKRMLMAIDYNAKGGLLASGKEPTNDVLQAKLTNKPMVLMLQIWAIEDKQTGAMKKGNWISSVAPRGEGVPEKVIPVGRETKQKTIEEEANEAFGDDTSDGLGF